MVLLGTSFRALPSPPSCSRDDNRLNYCVARKAKCVMRSLGQSWGFGTHQLRGSIVVNLFSPPFTLHRVLGCSQLFLTSQHLIHYASLTITRTLTAALRLSAEGPGSVPLTTSSGHEDVGAATTQGIELLQTTGICSRRAAAIRHGRGRDWRGGNGERESTEA